MLKTYKLTDRHFSWEQRPKSASERQVVEYLLDRALRSQGVVSLNSVCHLDAKRKAVIRRLIEARVRRGQLVPVEIDGEKSRTLDSSKFARRFAQNCRGDHSHPLAVRSPDHRTQTAKASVRLWPPFRGLRAKEKRVFGYFARPVLIGDQIVAAIDLKTDRVNQTLLIQKWTWIGRNSSANKAKIETELQRFECFQLQQSNFVTSL
jgi:uncharacterized protein YcaQ